MKLAQHLLPHGLKQYGQWVETLVISIAALAISYSIVPNDPLNDSIFPWVWMAPVLIALRYGVLMGVVSVLTFLLGWLGWAQYHQIDYALFPKLTFLGGTLMMMVTGEYSGVWITRTRRVEELQHYTEQRLELLTRRLYLLSLSHDKLEQDLIGRPHSLRDGLQALNQILPTDNASHDINLAGAQLYIDLIVQHCNLSVAGIHTVKNGRISPNTAASIGGFTPIDHNDALISYCLEKGDLVHINTTETLTSVPSRYLVAVPAKTANGEILGILAVEKLPFFALQADNMQTLQVLTSYYADAIASSVFAPQLTEKLKNCPIDFYKAANTLNRLQRDMQITSMIVGFAAPDNPNAVTHLKTISEQARGLDEVWTFEYNNQRICCVLLVLLPLVNETGYTGYINRINHVMDERFGAPLGELGILVHADTLAHEAIAVHLDNFITTIVDKSIHYEQHK
ncbi:MAG: GAF domain-containing protein [Sulfuriferula sp.]|nr:GAF domain-containing protein [Sulfuriferula sp.]